jgi:hypothetical protein
VIDRNAIDAQQQEQATVAEPPSDIGQFAQPRANDDIVGPHAAIAYRGSTRSDRRLRCLAHFEL